MQISFKEDFVILQTATPATGTFNTKWVGVNEYKVAGVSIVVSAVDSSPVFAAQVQVTNTPDDANSWANFGTSASGINATGAWAINAVDCGFRALRVALTQSGTGTATIAVNAQLKS